MRVAILTPDPASTFHAESAVESFARTAAPLRAMGLTVEGRPWTQAEAADLLAFDLVLPLVAWGYHFDLDGFRGRLAAWDAAGVRLRNPAPALSWNADKLYLADLAAAGAPTLPTRFVDRLRPEHLVEAAEAFGTDRLVAKPRVSAAASHTVKLRPGDGLEGGPEGAAMIQPFLPSVAETGELSLYYFDRAFSHAVLKRATGGDFRVQVQFGGENSAHAPDAEAFAAAESVLGAIAHPLLYARVDLIRDLDGRWALIEVELIEPDLYLGYAPDAGARFARAVRGAIEGAPARA